MISHFTKVLNLKDKMPQISSLIHFLAYTASYHKRNPDNSVFFLNPNNKLIFWVRLCLSVEGQTKRLFLFTSIFNIFNLLYKPVDKIQQRFFYAYYFNGLWARRSLEIFHHFHFSFLRFLILSHAFIILRPFILFSSSPNSLSLSLSLSPPLSSFSLPSSFPFSYPYSNETMRCR